jgi:hypothetical protein
MQSSAVTAAATPSLPRHVVRLSGALAALLSRAEGAEVPEDELLDWLKAARLVTHPSPLTAQHRAPAAHSATAAAQPAAASSADRRVVRLRAALALLMGRTAGAEISEAEILNGLREAGLITYPSPLLGRVLEELPEVLAAEVLPWVEPSARTVLAQVGRQWRAAVVASGLPRAGKTVGVPLKITDFIRSVELLTWAKENGCPWIAKTVAR